MATFNNNDPVAVKTDASKIGIAGILTQCQCGEWRIVSCCSRNTNNAEKNYGVSELEGLALVYSVTKFRNYLLGRKFRVYTDHCALCSLRIKTSKSPKLQRWALLLSEYDFEIYHVKGSLHSDVDCLSRAPVDQYVEPYLDEKIATILTKPMIPSVNMIVPLDTSNWKQLLERDEVAKVHYEKARRRQKGYKMMHGLLYYEDRLLVDKELQKRVLEECHDNFPSGHGGHRDTLYRARGYWWPGMAQAIKDYVDSCENCQRNKVRRDKPRGEMNSFEASYPMDLVAIDVLGPLPKSHTGKEHIFVAVDALTKFVELMATEDVQAATATLFIKTFIGRFGTPSTICTDNAPTFDNMLLRSLAQEMNFSHRFASPRHHEGNSLAERAIQTVLQKINSVCHDVANELDWEVELPHVQLAVNSSFHSSTRFWPYELMFGIEPRNPSELAEQLTELEQLMYTRIKAMFDKRGQAIFNQVTANDIRERYFNATHRPQVFKLGRTHKNGRRAKVKTGKFVFRAFWNHLEKWWQLWMSKPQRSQRDL